MIGNPKVTIQEYRNSFNCSEKTAIKYRQIDKDRLGLPRESPLCYEHFKRLYGVYPVSSYHATRYESL